MELYNEDFRDSISTVDASGKRVWIYPQKPSGNYHNKRVVVSIVLLTMLFSAPFIKIGGNPLFLFNIFERKFIILGKVFLPQDFHLFALGMILFFVFVILFTAIYGRVWCGWACPQTIFMEMVFRKIEYWIEGDAAQQRKLDAAPNDGTKIFKKGLKHFIFALLSILIGNLMLAYLVGVDRLSMMITHPPHENYALFTGVMVFSGLFYAVFARFREQACTIVCPYGRLQGVLMGKDTINIIYDFVRGEPRGKISNKKNEEAPKGDCIDCKLCVRVCPTGIDIRNGTQMECVGCTACIDACDEIMDKVGKPRGLIKYASYEEVKNGKPFKFTTRIKAYSVVLVLLVAAMSFLLVNRQKTETTILRAKGTTYIKLENEAVRNMFSFQVANKTSEKMNIELRLKSPAEGKIEAAGGNSVVQAGEVYSGAFVVDLERKNIKGMRTPLVIEVVGNGEVLETIETAFTSPYTK